MPVHYELDPALRIVRTTLSGAVSAEEVASHFAALRADPACPDSLDVLMDTSDLQTLVSVDLIRASGAELQRTRERIRFRSVAVVAPQLAQYGMFRMGQMLLEPWFERSYVSRSRDDAERWLAAVRVGAI